MKTQPQIQVESLSSLDSYSANCTLVACREVSGLDDKTIQAAWLRHGWVPGHGMSTYAWIAAAREIGVQLEEIPWKELTKWNHDSRGWERTTLRQFCKKYPTGTFLVTVHAHALVVRDGAVIDRNVRRVGGRRGVRCVYRVLNPVERPTGTHLRIAAWPGGDSRQRLVVLHKWLAQNDAGPGEACPRTPEQAIEAGVLSRRDLRRWLRKGVLELVP